jgi:hypothetical protein
VSGTFTYHVTVTDKDGHSGTISCSVTIAPPVSANCVSITAVQGIAITPVTMVGSGGTGGPYTFSSNDLPSGLSISTSGTISGTPTVSGTFTYHITVTDKDGHSGTISCSVTIAPPVSANCVSITAVQGIAITPVTLTGSGGTGGPYTFSSNDLPSGLTISTSGTISGTPTVSGTFTYHVTVTDKDGHSGTISCSVTIAPPVSANCVSITAVQGVAITPVTLTGSGGTGGPYTFSSNDLPSGLSISTSGTISGTPTVSGTFTYHVTVTDKDGHSGTISCSVTIAPAVSANCVSITAVQGVAITPVTLTGSGGAGGPYTFSSNDLPTGLSISSSGTISGTPLVSGTFTYHVTVKDKNGNTGTISCSVTIAAPVPISLTCAGGTGMVGTAFNGGVTVSGGVGPYTYSIVSGALPTGLTLNTSTGAITGTPTVAGTFSFTVKVVDALGNSALSQCNASCNTNPAFWDFSQPTGSVGTSHSYTVNGITITAYGFSTSGYAQTLYGHNNGGDENGLGIYGVTNNKIDSYNFVQVDLKPIIDKGGTNAMMVVDSVSTGETYSVYGSNTLGSIGTLLISNSTLDDTPFAIPNFPNYRYISVKGTNTGLVLFESVSFNMGNCSITVESKVDLQCGTCGSNKGYTGQPYSATLGVTGGQGPYTFSIISGSLPPGLTLNTSTGVISGTPTTPGNYTFTSKVTDAGGFTDTATCTITIYSVPLDLQCGVCGSSKAYVGTPYSAQLAATGGSTPYTFSITSGSLPPGLTLNTSTGVISGTPTTAGTYTISFKVVDSTGASDTATCTITVGPPPIDLLCGTCGSGNGTVGKGYSSQLQVSGGTAPYTFSITAGSLPGGLTLNTSNGVISGTPTTAGTYNITFKVVDSKGNSDTVTCTIVIQSKPLTLDCGNCGASKIYTGTAYSQTLIVTGGYPTYTFSIVSGTLPAGLTFSTSTGKVSGTPTQTGTFTITFKVTDSHGNTDTDTCTITVISSSVTLDCGSCGTSQASVGSPYSATLARSGGTSPFTFSITSGSLPPGLTLNTSNGTISGTPTTAGTYTYTAKVVDAYGKSDTTTCTITVAGQALDLQCGTCGTAKAYKGTAYSATYAVKGGAAPFTFSITSGSLPPGLSLNASTGVISGTPTTTGSYTFTAKVVDSKGKTDTVSCTLVVLSPVDIQCGVCGSAKAYVGKSYSQSEVATGGTGTYTFSIASGSLPPGLTLSSSTGKVNGTPSKTGTYTFTTKVVDSNGGYDTVDCTITVSNY